MAEPDLQSSAPPFSPTGNQPVWQAFGPQAQRMAGITAPTLTIKPPPPLRILLLRDTPDALATAVTDLEGEPDLPAVHSALSINEQCQLYRPSMDSLWLFTPPTQSVRTMPLSLNVDQTGGWAVADLWGRRARSLLAQHLSADLSPEAMPVGTAIQGLFALIPIHLLHLPGHADAPGSILRMIIPRSRAMVFTELLMDAVGHMRHMPD